MKRTQKTMIELLRKHADMYKTFMVFYRNMGNGALFAEYAGKYRAIKDVINLMEDDKYFSQTWESFENESEVEL